MGYWCFLLFSSKVSMPIGKQSSPTFYFTYDYSSQIKLKWNLSTKQFLQICTFYFYISLSYQHHNSASVYFTIVLEHYLYHALSAEK